LLSIAIYLNPEKIKIKLKLKLKIYIVSYVKYIKSEEKYVI